MLVLETIWRYLGSIGLKISSQGANYKERTGWSKFIENMLAGLAGSLEFTLPTGNKTDWSQPLWLYQFITELQQYIASSYWLAWRHEYWISPTHVSPSPSPPPAHLSSHSSQDFSSACNCEDNAGRRDGSQSEWSTPVVREDRGGSWRIMKDHGGSWGCSCQLSYAINTQLKACKMCLYGIRAPMIDSFCAKATLVPA